MLTAPRIGQFVRLWYAERKRCDHSHHGRLGIVQVVAKGPGPRNRGILLFRAGDRPEVVAGVPAGNLQPVGLHDFAGRSFFVHAFSVRNQWIVEYTSTKLITDAVWYRISPSALLNPTVTPWRRPLGTSDPRNPIEKPPQQQKD